jgi:hypothetical protein
MKLRYLPVDEAATKFITDQLCRSKILAVAIGAALASALPLPSQPVESPTEYAINNLRDQMYATLNDFNESIIFDLSFATVACNVLWRMRYNAAHPQGVPTLSDSFSFLETLIGAGTYMEPEFTEFVNKHKQQILLVMPYVATLLERDLPGNPNAHQAPTFR